MSEIASTDIWRAANMMLDLYGGDATLKAALRADALLEQGDSEGLFVWKRIAKAIDDMSRESAVSFATTLAMYQSRRSAESSEVIK